MRDQTRKLLKNREKCVKIEKNFEKFEVLAEVRLKLYAHQKSKLKIITYLRKLKTFSQAENDVYIIYYVF